MGAACLARIAAKKEVAESALKVCFQCLCTVPFVFREVNNGNGSRDRNVTELCYYWFKKEK